MAPEDPEYILPEPQKEVDRLTQQDAVIAHHMGGKRILAPLDISQRGLQILDSGTADGLWLREIQPLLTEPYQLHGYDVMPSFFPQNNPLHTTLGIHDIADAWPAEMHEQFDLVHQRFTLIAGGMRSTPRECVRLLAKLVRPGGWIQLGEMDAEKPVEGGPATRDVWTALSTWFSFVGKSGHFANQMANWLREEGFVNVQEEYVEINIGPRCKDAEHGAKSAQVMLNAVIGVAGALKSESFTFLFLSKVHLVSLTDFIFVLVMNCEVPEPVMDRLPERATAEWEKDGATYGIIFAYGQKPSDSL